MYEQEGGGTCKSSSFRRQICKRCKRGSGPWPRANRQKRVQKRAWRQQICKSSRQRGRPGSALGLAVCGAPHASCTHAGPRPAARRPRGIAQHASHDARPPQTPRPDARGPQLAAQLRDTCPCEKCARAPGRALRRDRETSGEQNCKSSRLFGGLQGQICKSSAVLSPRANLQKQESFGGPTPPLLRF